MTNDRRLYDAIQFIRNRGVALSNEQCRLLDRFQSESGTRPTEPAPVVSIRALSQNPQYRMVLRPGHNIMTISQVGMTLDGKVVRFELPLDIEMDPQ